jgi:hypothetical protein
MPNTSRILIEEVTEYNYGCERCGVKREGGTPSAVEIFCLSFPSHVTGTGVHLYACLQCLADIKDTIRRFIG